MRVTRRPLREGERGEGEGGELKELWGERDSGGANHGSRCRARGTASAAALPVGVGLQDLDGLERLDALARDRARANGVVCGAWRG